jgi:predicted nucleic acid-binding protein
MSIVLVDSNIWLYQMLDRQDAAKGGRVAERLASATALVISHQVLVEVGANLLKKGGLTEPQIRERLADMLASARLIAVDGQIVLAASRLREAHRFSYWDSLIVAAALEAGCTELWSEDLQTGRVVEGRLTIVNPLA